MGYGSYSHEAHQAMTQARAKAPAKQVFKQSACHPKMNPHGVTFRESRDSAEHPRSVGVIFALDVSGSMGEIPVAMATKTLPTFMKTLGDVGVTDPQLMFMAVGHCVSDRAPLQVGQFESEASLMDQWLTSMYLEGGGAGGNESYEVAMYFAARHTAMDCVQKRQHKGYLFITGDEPPNPAVVKEQVRHVIGDDLQGNIPLESIIAEVGESFELFYLIPDPQRGRSVGPAWRAKLGDRVVVMPSPEDTAYVAAGLVALCEGAVKGSDGLTERLASVGVDRARAGRIAEAVSAFAASRG